MFHPRRALRCLLLCVSTFGAASTVALAQDYPSRQIRIVTPFPPGGSADAVARLLAERLQESWRQPVIVDSRPGGNTLIAAGNVARSPADGYTLFVAIDFTLTLTKALYKQLPFDPDSDFIPISLLTTQPSLIAGNPKVLPVKSLPELLGYARGNKGKLNIGFGAVSGQLLLEEMKTVSGMTGEPIAYRGSQPTTNALLAGDVHFIIDAPLTNLPFVKDGRIAPLAVTSRSRMPTLPDVPSVIELGMPHLEAYSWFVLVAPAKTPPEIVTKINGEVVRLMATPEVRAKLADFALTAASSTPEELRAMLKQHSDRWTPVVQRAGIRFD